MMHRITTALTVVCNVDGGACRFAATQGVMTDARL
jgi:hypothetical protein